MTHSNLTSIVDSGINTFVSLERRQDYKDELIHMARLNKDVFPPHDVHFLNCPIEDHETLQDNQMWEFIEELGKLLEIRNRNVYIHCKGGHGRTGMVLVNLLQYIFGVDNNSAMEILRNSHKKRKCKAFCCFRRGKLEDASQEEQVFRLQKIMRHRQMNLRNLKNS